MTSFAFALIICNSEMPSKRIVKQLLSQNPFIVCADGGANAARKLGIIPHVIIGDFDSITNATREYYTKHPSVKFIYLQRQSDTDFEKALKYVLKKKISHVIVFGGTGKMTDHTLGNFSIMTRYADTLDIKLIDNHFEIELIKKKISFDAQVGERISLIPYPIASRITTSGLKYKLKNESLQLGRREGTCNQAIKNKVRIEVKKGRLLLFREVRSIGCIVFMAS